MSIKYACYSLHAITSIFYNKYQFSMTKHSYMNNDADRLNCFSLMPSILRQKSLIRTIKNFCIEYYHGTESQRFRMNLRDFYPGGLNFSL